MNKTYASAQVPAKMATYQFVDPTSGWLYNLGYHQNYQADIIETT